MLDYRPCGVCRALVSVKTGCPHWKPAISTGKRRGWVKGRARGSADTVTLPEEVPLYLAPGTSAYPCTCDKVPGPPKPHAPDCAKVRAHRLLTDGQGVR